MSDPRTVAELFGEEVKAERTHMEWTQAFVATEAGISMRQLQNIESGKCDPHTTVSLSVAAVLHISVDKYRDQALQECRAKASAKLAQ